LPRLEGLHFDCLLPPGGVGRLGEGSAKKRHRALTADVSGEAPEHLPSALRGWRFRNLARLHLRGADDSAARGLAEAPFAADLRLLDLFQHGRSPEGLAALGHSGQFAGLTWLGLGRGPVTDEGVRTLADSPSLCDLRYLDLHGTEVTEEGLDALA